MIFFAGYQLLPTFTHEVGHILGLDHSETYDAVMWPNYRPAHPDTILFQDDMNGIRALFGKCSLRNYTSDHH